MAEDYLTIDLHPGQVFIAGEECLYQTECVARFYLRAFRSACGFMLGHGQYRSALNRPTRVLGDVRY
eukprot:1602897-Rhodomonas_salina.3